MSEGVERNTRAIEGSVVTDFADRMSYGGYLDLDTLLSAQRPLSDPEHHDELLFIIQHQTTELWLKLVLHELSAACRLLRDDQLAPALKCIARVKHIQRTLTEQWSVLATLTPAEYVQFRGVLGNASGFQSAQYRAVEFTLGNKNAGHAAGVRRRPGRRTPLVRRRSRRRACTTSSCGCSRARAIRSPRRCSSATSRRRGPSRPSSCPIFAEIYADPQAHWAAYETCEELVDLEDNFQLWRFRHLKTVERIIGFKTGTGGSSGVPFLQRALELTFFPELFAVRHRDRRA